MLRSFFIFFFTCFIVFSSVAQVQDTQTAEQPSASEEDILTDTTLYKHDLSINLDTVNDWKTDKKFSYVKNMDSLLKLKEQELISEGRRYNEKTSPSFLQKLFSSGIVQVIFWAIAIALVLFILYRLFINQGIFRRNTTSVAVKEIEEQPVINNVSDYDALIHQSCKLANYRMALRYLFLKTLRQLSDKGLLHQSVDKTNFQYVQEIATDKRKDFAALVLNYEYVWYGHLDISREQFEQLEKNYISFSNKI